MQDGQYYLNYSHVSDSIAILLGIFIILYIKSTYVSRQKKLRLLFTADLLVILASMMSSCFHMVIKHDFGSVWLVYFFHHMSYTPLVITYVIFIKYLLRLLKIKGLKEKVIHYLVVFIALVFLVTEWLSKLFEIGFYFDSNGVIHDQYYSDPFRFAYISFSIVAGLLVVTNKKSFITKMYWCLISVVSIIFFVVLAEDFMHSTKFLNFTFIIPIMTVLFMYHYNAYDPNTGALDYHAFKGYIKEKKKQDLFFICLELPKFDDTRAEDLSEHFYHFNEKYFKNPITFRISDKMILVSKRIGEEEEAAKKKQILTDFEKLYQRYQKDYKILFLESHEGLNNADEYLRFIDFALKHIAINTFHQAKEKEIEDYLQQKEILEVLLDINQKKDLDDERVLAFCQPILEVSSGKYKTSESLMRMQPVGKPMLYPDQFIPLAESNGCIHTLSLIMLNKVCEQIRELTNEGYDVKRISINISPVELRDKNFCNDIINIINRNNVPFEKIAIEITESRDENNFELVKNVIGVLHNKGISIYLDDFGTGYSNMERIFKLPIDVIKFDRSLTVSSGLEGNWKMVIGSFSEIFKKMNYEILYEGVEDENDERRCIDMNAHYLQGFKYSKPIPIERLREFFERK